MSKFKTGDHVKIVKYGALFWENKMVEQPKNNFPIISETPNICLKDMMPELVGQKAIVEKSTETQGKISYALRGVSKYAWYDEEQLELL